MSFGISAGDFIAAATLTYKLILALSESSGSSMEYQQLIQDLSCVHRTLLQVEQMKCARQLGQSTVNVTDSPPQTTALLHQVDSAKRPIEAFLAQTEKYRRSLSGGGSGSMVRDSWRKVGWSLHRKEDVKALRDVLQLRLLSINVFVVQPRPGSELLLGPKEDIFLEDPSTVPSPNHTSDLVIFEHINLHSSGTDIKDPAFRSLSPTQAHAFFRIGQVFMILWPIPRPTPSAHTIADTDEAADEARRQRALFANNYIGPYTGRTTIRRFLVVHEGIRSSYCLPISTFSLLGSLAHPDPHNYGIIHTGTSPPAPITNETGMTKPPIRVIAAHPSTALPPQARIDYRRLCEVEHNVACKDVGLVDVDSMNGLLGGLEPVRVRGEGEESGNGGKGGVDEYGRDEEMDEIE
ncbi:hypothetical protein MMC21_008344 [Puttea exsequens]|nr:hypothetical protein [Puttea exsequens]